MAQTIGEKDILLREVHHRVKNNLQIIASILNLQAQNADKKTTHEIIKDSQDRIMSIALLHEEYYQSENLESIDIKNYVKSITQNIFQNNNQNKLVYQMESIHFSFDTLIPFGLILTEILTNSQKHGSKPNSVLEINLTGKKVDNNYLFTIRDNGIGFDYNNFHTNQSLGFKLIKGLTKQMNASVSLNINNGCLFEINIPIK